jgi:protein-disulfide isomerase
MIEFSDPECPYCVRYSRDIAPTLSEEYRGKVRFAFHHLVNAQTRPLAFQAAVAAECAGRQARFEEMYLRIFYDPNHDRGTLSQHAGAMHIDMSIFDDCTASEGPAAVNAAVEVARALGVNSTPSFMIGLARGLDKVEVVSTLTGVQPLARFREALDAVLGIPQ